MFVADYVLMEYGTGAIMAVPAHDQRDFDFAKTFDLEIRRVVEPRPTATDAPGGRGRSSRHSEDERARQLRPSSTACPAPEANAEIIDWLEERGPRQARRQLPPPRLARSPASATGAARSRSSTATRAASSPSPTTSSRSSCPTSRTTRPKGKSPLAAVDDWVEHRRARNCGGPARRETDTMDTFVDSSWYFLRYLDPHNDDGALRPRGRRPLDARRPVHRRRRARDPPPDVRPLLHEGARRPGPSSASQEPFANLFTQGMITRDGAKMSKSKGNTVSPADYVERYGADAARTYICFMGPPERGGDWTDEGVEGVHRFLSRLWRLAVEVAGAHRRRQPTQRGAERRRPRAAREGPLGDRQGHPRLRARLPVQHRRSPP